MAIKEIEFKRLMVKSSESMLKKAIELVVLALLIGASSKAIMVALPAIFVGSFLSKMIKLRVFG